MIKLDRLTAVLAALALASLCLAQRVSAQSTVTCRNPPIGTDVLFGTTAATSNCQGSQAVTGATPGQNVALLFNANKTTGQGGVVPTAAQLAAVLSYRVIAAP
ncbi:MAG TPA: hypothetical protein VGH04_13855 [Gemmatimonadaceae bacterium]